MPKCVDIEKIICDKMLEMMDSTPFYQIKITDLTKSANISRSTFYLYFSSCYDVIEKIEKDFLDGLINIQRATTEIASDMRFSGESEAFKDILATVQYLRQNATAFCALLGPNGDASFSNKLSHRIRHCLVDTLKNASYTVSKEKISLIAEFLVNGTLAYQRYAIRHPEKFDDKLIAETYWQIDKALMALLHS